MKSSKSFTCLLLGLTLGLAAGCQSKSPTEPSRTTTTPQPPTPVVTYNILVTANPAQLTAGSATPSNISIRVLRSDTGAPPPDLTPVTVTTSLGAFGSAGGAQTTILQLVNGQAQVALFAGSAIGTATVSAQVGNSAGAANVLIGQQATFFVSSINPGVGNPAGGDQVTISGGGFVAPVRVTFNGATADVLSVSPSRIVVRTPSATAAGVTVPVGQAVPVNVAVIINLNQPGQLSDSLTNGFVYSLGGPPQQPQVFSISPASGTNDGGTTVTLVGDGFQSPVQVFFGRGSASAFNGVEATVQSVTTNRIVVLTPSARGFGQSNLNQTVDILVRNLNTGFSTVMGQAFRYGTQVLITAMGPGTGSFLGGTRVTIFGQGFESPVAVTLGNNPAIGQLVLSVTGTEIIFQTVGIALSSCPANGFVVAQGVSVTNINTGDTATAANLAFSFQVPLPQIFGLSPNGTPSGLPVGSTTTINGQNFGGLLRVLFGDAATGSAASILSHTSSSVTIQVPPTPPGFTFTSQACTVVGPGGTQTGTQQLPTPINVTVTNLDTGCSVTLTNAFLLSPPVSGCVVPPAGPIPGH